VVEVLAIVGLLLIAILGTAGALFVLVCVGSFIYGLWKTGKQMHAENIGQLGAAEKIAGRMKDRSWEEVKAAVRNGH
jgi:hypothetical protein